MLPTDQANELQVFEDKYCQQASAAVGSSRITGVWLGTEGGLASISELSVAGWWCRPGDYGPNVVLPNPWEDRAILELMELRSWQVSRRIIELLSPRLDQQLGGYGDPEYWQLLLGGWMSFLVTAVADRALYLNTVKRVVPEAEAVTVIVRPPPATFGDSIIRLTTELGNAELMSLLVDHLGLKRVKQPVHSGSFDDVDSSSVYSTSQGLLPQLARAARRRPLKTLSGITGVAGSRTIRAATRRSGSSGGTTLVGMEMLGMTFRTQLNLLVRVRGLRFASLDRNESLESYVGGIDIARRQELVAGFPTEDELERLVLMLLPAVLPTSVFERFAKFRESSRVFYGGETSVVVAGFGFNERLNEFIGRCHVGGKKIAFAQHGGGYTQLRLNAQERLEVRPYSEFWSWGLDAPGFHPVSSPRLEAIRDTHTGGSTILVVEGEFPPSRYPLRFSSGPHGGQTYASTNMLEQFVGALDSHDKSLLRMRRWVHAGSGAKRSAALEEIAQAESGIEVTATSLMRTSCLVVITYPDTPFIESLVTGAPTVGMWSGRYWDWCDDVAAIYDELHRASVVFYDAEAAAQHIKSIRGRELEWWSQQEVVLARTNFVNRLGRGGDLIKDWTEGIARLQQSSA